MTKFTPYYAQSNSQVEATNKVIKENIAKVVKNNPRMWYEILPEILWAYRTLKRTSTGTSLYALTYGHEAVSPIDIKIYSLRVMKQNNLTMDTYQTAMALELKDIDKERIKALNNIVVQKKIVAKGYNKTSKRKSFDEQNLV